ncbi:MAG: permease [Candidatus Omnitrophica bacterium CG12_big_fil_rev_8_21_14_0_65_43_15]|uniref:Permease n=1 Tax=Candidatus Taenaricola geysiri TaxID=1974752 RepID=A0A2J0LGS6_9BACT|nr:MAG: permease [Candidatus Omnitrophica bacterium CG12_big_fil_rev_8_21_14_0_65_43_15]PIW80081.1 MAG: permease [Candidatus Omnitrophica bacterium CG_4_8_14_3_um_filter_43_15]PIY84641.1 MAG: permease [Candidatus Omnitrophica bacterium CG_4_10_14_0_8_um_filter_43_18]PJC46015.1 MAG: permease [Candidatus Omnitrophica bacterium CG_4_9_14_0_2_um_filter_43_12]
MLLRFAGWLTYKVIGLDPESHLGGAVNFFIYDSVKIISLLFFLILIIGFIRTYLPQHKIKRWMSGKGVIGNFFAAIFGAITPFCSCSSIPLFLGFLEAGIPLGVTFSFLITSPLINEYLVVLMLGFFGWKITAMYVVSGLLIGVISGVILGRMRLERFLVTDLIERRNNNDNNVEEYPTFIRRLRFGYRESTSIVRKIWVWVLVGVGIGAIIHNYVPQEVMEGIIAKTGGFSVPIATLLGVPMYGSCAAIVPIAVVLFQKGIPLGTALAFMMAIAALSLPEAIMLRRAMKLKLIAIFFGVTTAAIILIGYMFNFLQRILL